MNRFKKWAEREYSRKERIAALIPEGILFVIVVPVLLVVTSSYIDQWLELPRFTYGLVNPLLGLALVLSGWSFSLWSILAQFSQGRGTPVPIMPTQELVVKRPYTYCRNPMALGYIIFCFGIAIWIGSLSAVGFTLLFVVSLVIYVKLVEEKELEERFGSEYLQYKRKTPFLVPHLRKRN